MAFAQSALAASHDVQEVWLDGPRRRRTRRRSLVVRLSSGTQTNLSCIESEKERIIDVAANSNSNTRKKYVNDSPFATLLKREKAHAQKAKRLLELELQRERERREQQNAIRQGHLTAIERAELALERHWESLMNDPVVADEVEPPLNEDERERAAYIEKEYKKEREQEMKSESHVFLSYQDLDDDDDDIDLDLQRQEFDIFHVTDYDRLSLLHDPPPTPLIPHNEHIIDAPKELSSRSYEEVFASMPNIIDFEVSAESLDLDRLSQSSNTTIVPDPNDEVEDRYLSKLPTPALASLDGSKGNVSSSSKPKRVRLLSQANTKEACHPECEAGPQLTHSESLSEEILNVQIFKNQASHAHHLQRGLNSFDHLPEEEVHNYKLIQNRKDQFADCLRSQHSEEKPSGLRSSMRFCNEFHDSHTSFLEGYSSVSKYIDEQFNSSTYPSSYISTVLVRDAAISTQTSINDDIPPPVKSIFDTGANDPKTSEPMALPGSDSLVSKFSKNKVKFEDRLETGASESSLSRNHYQVRGRQTPWSRSEATLQGSQILAQTPGFDLIVFGRPLTSHGTWHPYDHNYNLSTSSQLTTNLSGRSVSNNSFDYNNDNNAANAADNAGIINTTFNSDNTSSMSLLSDLQAPRAKPKGSTKPPKPQTDIRPSKVSIPRK